MVASLSYPSEGWIRTVRKALGMSGAQLGRRLDVTRALISNTEKAELSGGVTLRTMRQMAEAMECRFIYVIVPEGDIEEIIKKRALTKARTLVKEASIQMALEEQTLSRSALESEVKRLAAELADKMDSDFWNAP